ncbi:ABC transporter ATP-binding protein [Kosmotoga pacifica]|uniref:ABC transporter n=1 Tax=Kosmotoga pacifica TaxID=1330330 RepID=A0A0G2ZF01_9BACT|nr:ABC transporter ATP-binding protein [Kosmotoga pacifica]AKI97408.1 ABC transporter [Kosmotoga pacifica]
MKAFVELKNISKHFKDPHGQGIVKAVDGISFQVKQGELVTLLGPSGCGKTTTLRIIGGFEIQNKGDVLIDGAVVNNLPPNRRPTAMVFQSYALFPHMNVFENVAYGLKIRNFSRAEIRRKVLDILDIVGLTGLENRYPGKLSGGQQQRVALARAIVLEPKLLLLDEPLSNLDAKLREQMRIELKKIQKRVGITSVYVTHDQLEAMTLSDKVVVMNSGKIVQEDTPANIYRFPTNKFVASFIGRANFIEATLVDVQADSVRVKLKNGKEIGVVVIHDNWKIGEKVLVVARPESITLTSVDKGDIVGTIENSIYTGNMVTFEVVSDGSSFEVDMVNPYSSTLPALGEKIGLKFNQKSITIVRSEDNESGE